MAPATRPNQISHRVAERWKQQLLNNAEELFEESSGKEKDKQHALVDERPVVQEDWPVPNRVGLVGTPMA